MLAFFVGARFFFVRARISAAGLLHSRSSTLLLNSPSRLAYDASSSASLQKKAYSEA